MRSQRRNSWQCRLSQRVSSSMRLPLQTSRPFSAQYRQIALCTNRGNVAGKAGLNSRASMLAASRPRMPAHPPGPVAALAVGMVGAKPPQDSGSVQEIMDQGVDRHEGRADFDPQRPSLAGAQQQGRQAPSPRPCQQRHRRCAAGR